MTADWAGIMVDLNMDKVRLGRNSRINCASTAAETALQPL